MFLAMDPGTQMLFVWFGIIIVAAVIEAATMDLSSIWFSVGGLFALLVAIFLPDYIAVQAILFIVASTVLLIFLRPIFKEHMRKNEIKTNADALVGKVAVCQKEIKDGQRGEVKIEGKIWTAISNEDIAVDEKVIVLAIKGVKLVVRKQ